MFVVAHPDDEILGAGATMYELAKSGNKVSVCCLSSICDTRYDDLVKACNKTHAIIGVEKSYIGRHGALMLQSVNHLELVRFIEDAIMDSMADVIFTHHPNDSNIDHFVTAEVCFEAARLPQRGIGYRHRIENILTMEVPSETDWQFSDASKKFVPNTFQGVSTEAIEAKIKALGVYDSVLRASPHPRSTRNIAALACVRGSECGLENAEAFRSVFRIGV